MPPALISTPKKPKGLKDGGWRQNIFDFYTADGAAALGDSMKNWQGGRLVVNVVENPIKCPVAPLEFLLLADWYFTKRGMRNKVELIYATPLSGRSPNRLFNSAWAVY